jgi:hypothetical protein
VGSLSGKYKHLFFRTEDSQNDTIHADLNRLRLQVEGAYGPLAWRLVYDHQLLVGDLLRSPDFALIEASRDPTFLDLESTIRRGRNYEWRHLLYRAILRWEHPYGHVLIGRQRIAWGSGRLWNPTDFFNPVSPTAIEPDEKVGVDALFLTFNRGAFGALQLVGAPGRDERGVAHKGAIRWRDTVGVTDYALLIGNIDDKIVLGGDLTTNLFDGGLRFEALMTLSTGRRASTQVVAGYDYTLTTALFPAGLYLLVEYLYNSDTNNPPSPAEVSQEIVPTPEQLPQSGTDVPPPTTGSNRLETRSHHQLGLSASYDLTPLWNLKGAFIIDLEEGSRFFAPTLTWSVTSNIDLTATVQLFGGTAGSEFGDRHNLYLMQLEAFF